MKVLVVDDEAAIRETLRGILEDEGFSVSLARDALEAKKLIESQRPEIVLLDLFLPGISGMELLQELSEKGLTSETVIIVISGHGTIQNAVKAVKLGAFDFIEKPLGYDRLMAVLEKAKKEVRLLRQKALLKAQAFEQLIGESRAVRELKEKIKTLAKTDSTVLIYGESGSGKELVARSIHQLSQRRDFPFVPVNCAAIPENLIEAELFGYEKGAFTGAELRKEGKFELADGGTLFLDEIGDMPLQLQSKLLRAIETKEIERVGAVRSFKVDVRILSATNKELEKEVEKGNFRQDLFFRINVIPLRVPPLRERESDVLLLAEHFLEKFSQDYKRPKPRLSDSAQKALLSYNWPGNVRELKNLMERVVILCQKDLIDAEDLSLGFSKNFYQLPLKEAREAFERDYIQKTLKRFGGDVKAAAEFLKIDISSLYRKISKYGIGNGI